MIANYFEETASFSKSPSDTMSQAAIITLSPYGVLLSNYMIILLKSNNKISLIICKDTIITNPGGHEFFFVIP
jgi:hypothetical protein